MEEELLEMAIKIQEHCKQKTKEECRKCIFGNGYGHCHLEDIPETWEV